LCSARRLILVLTPALTAGAITEEKVRGTLTGS